MYVIYIIYVCMCVIKKAVLQKTLQLKLHAYCFYYWIHLKY